MQQDCIDMSQRMRAHQLDTTCFLSPPKLLPTKKGNQLFSVWAIETVVWLSPAIPSWARDICVTICAFTKWVEAGILPSLDSHAISIWFYEAIIFRYRFPGIVRMDRSTKYHGEFYAYLTHLEVHHHMIATRNPRANG